MQDTFARTRTKPSAHYAKRARNDRVSSIQAQCAREQSTKVSCIQEVITQKLKEIEQSDFETLLLT